MSLKWKDKDLSPVVWNTLKGIIGEHPELVEAKQALERITSELEQGRLESEQNLQKLKAELDQARGDRLQWMGKESAVRAELQECRDRSKDLLEQVVRLTHQQRESKKNLLDQEFKTNLMPLERNRYEMELVEARAKVRKADEHCKEAQEQLAQMQTRLAPLAQDARRVKELESKLSWAEKQRKMHEDGLSATIAKLKDTERCMSELHAEHRRQAQAPAPQPRPAAPQQAQAPAPHQEPRPVAPQQAQAPAPHQEPRPARVRKPYQKPDLRSSPLTLSIADFLALPAPEA